MKIKNNTSEDIIIVCDGEEFECASGSFIKIQTNQDEITVKQPQQNILSCFKVFRYDDKDSIKGNVIYFHPGFHLNYATKISPPQDLAHSLSHGGDTNLYTLLKNFAKQSHKAS